MDEEPGDPRNEAAELEALDVRNRLGPSDRREVAFVAVAKRWRRAPLQARTDRARGVAALLHRDRREAG